MLSLKSIEDPRDLLEKATRKELENYAKENGIKEIKQTMPAVVMRQLLRRRGVFDVGVRRTLGRPMNAVKQEIDYSQEASVTMSADDALMKQWEVDDAQDDYSSMHIGKLRKLVKQRGLKQDRKDGKQALIDKLRGVDGKDAT